ncbi:MAG: STAS domain-containing protein [Candidatus Sericytochromatia bacterium]
MYIQVEYRPNLNWVTLYLEGNLTAATCRDFEKKFQTVLPHPGVVLLDLSEVKLLDSTGLGSLIRVLKLSIHHQSRLLLAGIQASPRLVLELTRTEQLFEIYDSLSAALASLEMEAQIA